MKTKYPILLVHGVMIKDLKHFKAFGKIEKILNESGFIVYSSKTDGFGTIENNASMLKEQIMEIMRTHNTDKVNLICHSKGGLDSKYMIKNLDMEDHIASLTTLCTPHKGSKIATKLLSLPKFIVKILEFWLNLIYKIFGDKNPDCLKVANQLKSVETVEKETLGFSDKIYCQSFSSELKKSTDDFVMGIPLIFSKYYEKDISDGVVSTESSKFENYRGEAINDSISHTEIVDFLVRKEKREKVHAFYIKLCEELSEMGY